MYVAPAGCEKLRHHLLGCEAAVHFPSHQGVQAAAYRQTPDSLDCSWHPLDSVAGMEPMQSLHAKQVVYSINA